MIRLLDLVFGAVVLGGAVWLATSVVAFVAGRLDQLTSLLPLQ